MTDVLQGQVTVGLDRAPSSGPQPPTSSGSRRAVRVASDYGIALLTVGLLVVGVLAVPGFGATDNLETLMRDAAFVGIVALGMTFVVMSGNYVDLSVAAQVGVAAVCAIALQPEGLLVGLLAGAAACVAIGLVNGLLVGYGRANAVVVTLGVATVTLAVLNEITQGALYAGQHEGFARFAGQSLGPVPIAFAFLLAVAAVASFALNRMSYGRRLRAVGSNRSVAELAGVPAGRIVLVAFVVTSGCCCLAGALLSGFVDSANPTIAADYTFEALAAVIVGGTTLTGGRGGAWRTVIGVLLIAVIANLLIVVGLTFEWQQLIKGAVIVVAVAFDAVTRKLGAR